MCPSPLPFFDTHAHLDLDPFADDFQDVQKRLVNGNLPNGFTIKELEKIEWTMQGVVLPGIDVESSRRCVELAKTAEFFYAAVGIQPNSTAAAKPGDWEKILELQSSAKVVGIGETGLDRYWDTSPIEIQQDFFQKHLELARTTKKPILIHCRDAWSDLLPILRLESDGLTGLIHAFSGEPQHALECVALGLSISFAGSVTYTNKKFAPLWETAKVVPEERLLIETDSPYMVPHPFRSKLHRNDPSLASAVAVRLAELRGVSIERIAIATTENAQRFFGGEGGKFSSRGP